MNNIHGFPQELTDLIIDLLVREQPLRSRQRTLACATLVCRLWHPRSSMLLLKRLEVDILQLPRFASFVKTSERLGSYVHELIINGTVDFNVHADDILGSLCSLRMLELWSNYAHGQDLSEPITKRRYRVEHLKLSSLEPSSIRLLLRPFQNIGTLELRSVDDVVVEEEGEGIIRIPHGFPIAIDRLVLNDCCTSGPLLALGLLVRPVAIFINGFEADDLALMMEFLEESGKDVEHLALLPLQDDSVTLSSVTMKSRLFQPQHSCSNETVY